MTARREARRTRMVMIMIAATAAATAATATVVVANLKKLLNYQKVQEEDQL